jgi:hypothetical protein
MQLLTLSTDFNNLYFFQLLQTNKIMATRSRIGIQLADESILSVYCHWDGYPEFNGVKLQEHFNSNELVAELIDGGDISCLWTNAGWNNEVLPTTGPLYYSSRGENLPPSLDSNLKEYLSDGAEEYAYLFTNGEWVCYNTRSWDEKYLQQVEIPVSVCA